MVVSQTALYYPDLIPNSRWIKQCLLYWDNFSSIVPDSLVHKSRLFNADVQYLIDTGIYRPIFCTREALLPFGDNLVRDYIDIVSSNTFPVAKRNLLRSLPFDEPEHLFSHMRIFEDKMFHGLIYDLSRRGVQIKYDNKGYHFEYPEGAVYMSLLAKHLSAHSPTFTTPVTDSDVIKRLVYENNRVPSPTNLGLNIIISNLIPLPGDDVPYHEILEFKAERKEELNHFRILLDEFYFQLSKAHPEDFNRVWNNIQMRIRKAHSDLVTTLKESKIRTVLGTVASLLATLVPTAYTMAGMPDQQSGPLHFSHSWDIPVLGVMAGVNIGSAALRYRQEQNAHLQNSPYTYVINARNTF